MHHPLRHRILCILAALSLAFSAAPITVTATPAEGHPRTCSLSDVSPASEAGGPGAAPAAAVTGAEVDRGDLPCEPGPCPMPYAACAVGGACLSLVPLPGSASAVPAPDLLGASSPGAERNLSSPASAILTPPPRG